MLRVIYFKSFHYKWYTAINVMGPMNTPTNADVLCVCVRARDCACM